MSAHAATCEALLADLDSYEAHMDSGDYSLAQERAISMINLARALHAAATTELDALPAGMRRNARGTA